MNMNNYRWPDGAGKYFFFSMNEGDKGNSSLLKQSKV
jgi:hypothetical protein